MDGTDSIIGRVVAIHAGQDDVNSLPGGGSGDIAACGIIEGR
jgi:Cu/Zn superoxide dismutase